MTTKRVSPGTLTSSLQLVLMAAGLLSLAGCGGGGGGSPASSPTPAPSPQSAELSVSASVVNIRAKYQVPPPNATVITAHYTGTRTAAVGAAYKPGITPADWLDVGASPKVGGDVDFSFAIKSGAVTKPPGIYTTTVTVGSADSAGNILHTIDIAVTFDLREGVRITTFGVSASGTNSDGVTVQTHQVDVAAPAGTQWTVSSNAPWLTVPAATMTGPGSITVTTDHDGMRSGTYAAVLTINNLTDTTDNFTQNGSLFVQPGCINLGFDSQTTIGGESGLAGDAVPVKLAIGDGARQFPWTATAMTTSGGNWMQLSATSGTASSAWTTVLVGADRAHLSPGLYEGTLRLQSNIYGDICTNDVPIHARVEVNRLLVSSAGVGLSKAPSRSVLTRTLRVYDSWRSGSVAWNATSSALWLGVTSSGTTGGSSGAENGGALTLTADPTGLAPGQYFANVSVSGATSGQVENSQSVRVGLTVRASDPPASVDPATTPSVGQVAANPVTPEFYACGGAGFTVEVYDAYSGALTRSFPGDCSFGMTVSDDGSTLYMRGGGSTVTAEDAVSGAVLATYQVNFGAGGLLYLRPDAHPVLLTGGGVSVDLDAAATRNDNNESFGPYTRSADQHYVYGASQYESNYQVVQSVGVRYSTLVDRRIVFDAYAHSAAPDPASSSGSAFNDVAVSQVSGRVFGAADGVDRRVAVFDASTLAPLPSLDDGQFVYAVDTHWSGNMASMDSRPLSATHAIVIYDDSGAVLTSLSHAGANVQPKGLVFSADGTRLLSVAGSLPHIDAVP